MAALVTGDAVVLEVQLAQLPVRAAARLIDAMAQLVLGVVLLVVFFFALLATLASGDFDSAWTSAMSLFLVFMVLVGFPVLYETLSRGRSLGKAAMGLRVVAEDGGPVRFRQALVRGLMSPFEIYMFGAAPAVISSLVSAKGKRIGDVFAGTVVISERAGRIPFPMLMPWGLAPWASTLSLGRLSPELVRLAQQHLQRSRELRPEVSQALEQRIAFEIAASISPAPPADMPPRTFISAVLAERHQREWRKYAAVVAKRDALRERREQALAPARVFG